VELKNVFDDGQFDEWIQVRDSSMSVSGEIRVIMSFQVSIFIINHLKEANNSIYILALLNVNIH
jgi:hypothetical protein